MTKLRFSGPLSTQVSSFCALNKIAIKVYFERLFGKDNKTPWDANTEIGIRFWRRQFIKAMQHKDLRNGDMRKGRELLYSLQTKTDEKYDVKIDICADPLGSWFRPEVNKTKATILYFHGGGYAFGGPMSERFASMFAHHIGADLFMPRYRLTPENPHPAQSEDALAAWTYITQIVPPENVVIMGDSAGGHMALMLLLKLKELNLPQPALCIGLCPWTDIGDRGQSLTDNDQFDLVQGWMALQFGKWLDPDDKYGREALSPIYHDYSGLAPLYMQTGGREILHDMIVDFANIQRDKGADVKLEIWNDMPHNFQIYDGLHRSSIEALGRLRQIVANYVEGNP